METLFSPIIILLKTILMVYHNLFGGFAVPLLLLSATTSLCMIPFERWGARVTQKEKDLQKLIGPQIARIKQESKGKVRHDRITSLYSRYAYHPIYALQSASGLLIQLPLLFSAYYMIDNLEAIKGVPILPFIVDLSQSDHILWGVNLLPLVMTAMNVVALLTTPGFTRKDTIQGLVVAGLFLLLLYNSPAALLLYWTANNLFSLVKNLQKKWMGKSNGHGSRKMVLLICCAGVALVMAFALSRKPLESAPVPVEQLCGMGSGSSEENGRQKHWRLNGDKQYAFADTNPHFPYANPTVSNLSLSSRDGLVLPNNEWGEFAVAIAAMPLGQPLALELTMGSPEKEAGKRALTVRDTVSGEEQVFTSWWGTVELGGVSLDEKGNLRIQVLCEGGTQACTISSMALRTSLSKTQLKELFDSASTVDTNYVWQESVEFASEQVESFVVTNDSLIVKSVGLDPHLIFKRMEVPNDSAAVCHVQIVAPEATKFQLFYQTAGTGGFAEERAFWKSLHPGENSLYLALPKGFTGVFRIDPGTLQNEQVYEIRTLEFRSMHEW